MTLRLSVIIPAYNHLPLVMRCYQSLKRTCDPLLTDIFVQDDNSPEYHGEMVFDPGVCQRNPANLGFPGNCQAGAKRTAGDILLFVNQDCVAISPNWDHILVDRFESDDQIGIVGPTLLFPNGYVQSVGGEFDAKCQPTHIALGFQNPDWQPINTPRPVSWVTGAVFAVRRKVWEAQTAVNPWGCGGFDPIYGRGYFEDVDLCARAALKGWAIWHEPGARFIHEVGSTGGNPDFAKNALEFKRRFVDSGYVLPDIPTVKERFW